MVDLSFFSYTPACTIVPSIILFYSSLDWILSSQLFVISFLELLVDIPFLQRFALSAGVNGARTAILKRNTIIRRKTELTISWMSFVIKNIHLSIKFDFSKNSKKHSKRCYCIVEKKRKIMSKNINNAMTLVRK